MRLDGPTLMLATSLLTAMVGSLFLLSWSQDRRQRALAIWGLAHLAGALASALLSLRDLIPHALAIGLGNAVLLGAYGAIWCGVRAFEGRPARLALGLAGGLVWILACLVPAFYGSLLARVLLASAIAGTFCTLAALEIWRGRSEPLMSRYPATVLLAGYAALYFVRLPLALGTDLGPHVRPLETPWLAVMCLAGMLFSLATAFVFMALTKERAERRQRLAAETDALTGAASRRAFVAGTQALLAGEAPVSVLLFDLDHFKRINDAHGHAVGDGVLVGFAALASAVLPPGALFGRLGGEEFACALAGMSPSEARLAAGSLCEAFGGMSVPAYPGLTLGVSVGLADSRVAGRDFDALLRSADEALYRAKRNGRNRVEVAGEPLPRAA